MKIYKSQLQKLIKEVISEEQSKKHVQKPKDYSEVIFKIDKWMPDDEDLQNEFHMLCNDGDIKQLANFIRDNADQEVLSRYMKHGKFDELAKAIIRRDR